MKALILLTRIPKAGFTKTRLMTHLTGEQCEQLHQCFLKDLYSTFTNLIEVDIFVSYAPENLEFKSNLTISPLFSSFVQQGISIGDRMCNAFHYVKNLGYEQIVLIGADVPQVSESIINQAFEGLHNQEVVIGPTKDGGYYLIGMKDINSSLFYLPIDWGTSSVYTTTIKQANSLNLDTLLLESLRDIDNWEDLEEFRLSNFPCFHTNKYLTRWYKRDDK